MHGVINFPSFPRNDDLRSISKIGCPNRETAVSLFHISLKSDNSIFIFGILYVKWTYALYYAYIQYVDAKK